MVAWFGVLGVVVAGLNFLALRVVRADEVPSCVRGRILWWGVHNVAFLLLSVLCAVAGLIGLVTSA